MILSELADYNVKFGNEQNSVRDQEYRQAVESNNRRDMRRLVEEAAKDNGFAKIIEKIMPSIHTILAIHR